MEKDFDKWNGKKKVLHKDVTHPFFHEREVWWCFLGANIGFEQDGGADFVRPVLVFKKFNNEVFWALPLSTKVKKGRYYSPVNLEDAISRVAILSQVRLIDAKRLRDKVGMVSEQNFGTIQKALIHLVTYERSPDLSGPAEGRTEAEAV
ncbi:MAG: type II toxin-antitoxin system PemK/MazF family toxin [bacterium]|nr:type II toxin-antitoxin system PemK/MazF family toxin [bacterium]